MRKGFTPLAILVLLLAVAGLGATVAVVGQQTGLINFAHDISRVHPLNLNVVVATDSAGLANLQATWQPPINSGGTVDKYTYSLTPKIISPTGTTETAVTKTGLSLAKGFYTFRVTAKVTPNRENAPENNNINNNISSNSLFKYLSSLGWWRSSAEPALIVGSLSSNNVSDSFSFRFPPVGSVSCTPRPACLDTKPRCLIPEPAEGWCSTPVPQPGGQCTKDADCDPCRPPRECPQTINRYKCVQDRCVSLLQTIQKSMQIEEPLK